MPSQNSQACSVCKCCVCWDSHYKFSWGNFSVLVSFGGRGSPTPRPGVPDTGSPESISFVSLAFQAISRGPRPPGTGSRGPQGTPLTRTLSLHSSPRARALAAGDYFAFGGTLQLPGRGQATGFRGPSSLPPPQCSRQSVPTVL